MRRLVATAVLLALGAVVVAPSLAQAATPKRYTTCAKLNAVYPHGVAKTGARDRTTGKAVTTFRVNTTVYKLNTARDRDHDGVACEKR